MNDPDSNSYRQELPNIKYKLNNTLKDHQRRNFQGSHIMDCPDVRKSATGGGNAQCEVTLWGHLKVSAIV
jgi:hypothetical protein